MPESSARRASVAFSEAEPLLHLLALTLEHAAEAVGAAAAQDCAVAAYFAGGLLGALICEAEGLPVAKVCAQFSELSPILGEDRHTLARRWRAVISITPTPA